MTVSYTALLVDGSDNARKPSISSDEHLHASDDNLLAEPKATVDAAEKLSSQTQIGVSLPENQSVFFANTDI